MKGFFPLKKSLWGLAFFLLAAALWAQTPYDEVDVQGHRCLVARSADLPDDAPLVLILHGFGTNGDVEYDLSQQLALPPCLLVFPDGPFRAPRSPSGGRDWYGEFTHSYKDMKNSRDYLFAVMDRFSKEPSDPDAAGILPKPRPIIIMGFSQGAKMALEAGLNYKGPIEAIISMGGFIEYPEKTLVHPLASKKTKILLVRGQWDPVIQEEEVRSTARDLKKAGYHSVLVKEVKGGHSVTYQTKQVVSEFLQRILSPNP